MLSLGGLSAIRVITENSTHVCCYRRQMLHRDTLAAAAAIYKGEDQMKTNS